MPELGTIVGLGIMGVLLLLVLTFWTIVWKGIALWIAAQEKSKKWFVAILVLNTFGILEIVYLIWFSARGKQYIADWKAKRASKKSQPTPIVVEEAKVETKVEEPKEEVKEEPKEETKTPSEQ